MTDHHGGGLTPSPAPVAARPGRPSRKIGMGPGSLVYIGAEISGIVDVEVYHCTDGSELERRGLRDIEELTAYRDALGTTWVDVNGVHDVALIGRIGEIFDLHPLLLEDVVNAHQRPKFEQHGEHLFLVVKMLLNSVSGDEIEEEQVSIVLGSRYVITFQERARDTFDPVRRRLADPATRLRQHGADFLAYALVDTIVDNYFGVLEKLGDRIEDLEDAIVADPSPDRLEEIFEMKRVLVELRRVVWPLRDALAGMGRGDTPMIEHGTLPYLRDVHDHTLRVIDTIETYRDTAATMVEMYMSGVSNRMNEVMKVLTVIATIFIPLTFIAGLYGMNFVNMPELHWRWGYPVVLVAMGVTTAALLLFFRKRGWL
jgi:magnesium transporter